MKWISGIVPLTAALLLVSAASRADDKATTVIGSGIVCNTSDQVAQLTRLMENSTPQEALAAVNREVADPTACGAVVVVFEAGKKVGDLRNSKGTYQIREIRIIAAEMPDGWHSVPPQTQYTVLREPGIEI